MINNDSINIIVAGDFVPPNEFHSAICSDELRSILNDKDFSIVNLEAPLTQCTNAIRTNGNNIKRNPEAVRYIIESHFDAVTLSNNHIRDFGDEGVLDTLNICKLNNIKIVGAGKHIDESRKPLRISIKGKRLSFLNYCEQEYNIASDNRAGANPFDTINAYYDIQNEKRNNDFVIVIYHGGLEYHNIPLPGLKRKLEFMIESGADCVFCHHTHYISGYSYFKGKPIFYGLGNFYFKYKSKKLLNNSNLHIGLLVKLIITSDSKIRFDLYLIKKNKDQNTLHLLPDEFNNYNHKSRIDEYNKIINSELELSKYWNNQTEKYKLKYYTLIRFKNKFIGKVINKLAYNFLLNGSWTRKIVNLFRCDSHREIIIKSFSDE